MKRCNKCGVEKPLGEFRIAKTTKPYGVYYHRRTECKQCASEYNQAHYRINLDERRAAARDYANRNYHKVKERQKKHREDNHEYYLKKYRDRYWSDPDRFREEQRQRRIRNLGLIPGDYTKVELMKAAGGPICAICNRTMEPRDLTIDHIQPTSQGGTDERTNVQLACFSCNIRKNDGRRSPYRP